MLTYHIIFSSMDAWDNGAKCLEQKAICLALIIWKALFSWSIICSGDGTDGESSLLSFYLAMNYLISAGCLPICN